MFNSPVFGQVFENHPIFC